MIGTQGLSRFLFFHRARRARAFQDLTPPFLLETLTRRALQPPGPPFVPPSLPSATAPRDLLVQHGSTDCGNRVKGEEKAS